MDTTVKTMVATETLAEWYIRESWAEMHGQAYGEKRVRDFREALRDRQGIGQAFYNTLRPGDQLRVATTIHDPFHGGVTKTHQCIDFLTTKRKEA